MIRSCLKSVQFVALAAGAGVAIALLAACGDDDAKPTAPALPTQPQSTFPTSAAPAPATPSPSPVTSPTAAPRTPSPSPSPGSSGRGVDLPTDPRPLGATTKLTPPAKPPSAFSPVPAGNVVLFDTSSKTATDFGPGANPSFSPDGTRMIWVSTGTAGTLEAGEIKLLDLPGGTPRSLGPGRFARFLDADHVTYFSQGNNKVSLDLKTNTTTPIANDDALYFERLDAARSTTPDGYRITTAEDKTAKQLPRGTVSSQIVRVTDTKSGAVALEFRAYRAVPAGRGFIAAAAPVVGDSVNLFLIEIATGKAEFVATTRLSEALPIAGDDNRLIWTDGYCTAAPGGVFLFERAAKRLTEVDTSGKAWWVLLTPSGQVGLGEFGAHTLYDPATFNALVQLPSRTGTTNGADIAWSPDYRYAAYGTTGGHGGLC